MAQYAVRESPPLRGEIPISTSKNAVLPIMCGALLTREDVRIDHLPALSDVTTLSALLSDCGCRLKHEADALIITAEDIKNPQDEESVRKMRASVLVLGPLLARLGQARIALPGGCAIGQRPIDQHLKGMSALGAKVHFDHGGVTLSGRLRGTTIYLDMPSVGATENLLMAATLAEGTTRIENAAKEPEIVDLAAFLTAMGARIGGAGTSTIVKAKRFTGSAVLYKQPCCQFCFINTYHTSITISGIPGKKPVVRFVLRPPDGQRSLLRPNLHLFQCFQ